MNLCFTPFNEPHFPLMLKWLETEHVKKWWDQDIIYDIDLIKEKYGRYAKGYKLINGIRKTINAYIICLEEKEIGYIQIYNAYDFLRSKTFENLPDSLAAFDFFIGEVEYLRKGLSSLILEQFFKSFCNYEYIFADPDINNIAAIKSYNKVGFKIFRERKDISEIWLLKKLNH